MMMSIIVCIIGFLLVGVFSQKESIKSFYYSPSLIERAEIFIFFIIIILFPSIVLMLGLIYTLYSFMDNAISLLWILYL